MLLNAKDNGAKEETAFSRLKKELEIVSHYIHPRKVCTL